MKQFLLALTFLSTSANWCLAAKPVAKIEGPTVVSGSSFMLSGLGSTADLEFPLEWSIYEGPKATLQTFDKAGRIGVVCYVDQAEPGDYSFLLKTRGMTGYTIGGVEKQVVDIDFTLFKVRVGPAPIPVPPVPPVPVPVPPTPTPVPVPPIPPANAMEALGQAWGKSLISSYAQCLDESATMLVAGVPMSTVMSEFNTNWEKRRTMAFAPIKAAYALIHPEGTEPSETQKGLLISAWKNIARGVRSASR